MIHIETDLRGDAYRRLMDFCFLRSDARLTTPEPRPAPQQGESA